MSRDWTREEFGITDNTPVVDINSLERKCERLQKQLEIAVECLKIYALENLVAVSKDGSFTMEFKSGSFSRAKNALKEIEELNK